MKLIRNTITLLSVSLGAAMLAGPAAAVPVPIASEDYNGTIDFSLSNGLSVVGTLDARYRTPPGSPRPYEFNSALNFGAISITPEFTITTPEIELIPEICVPFLGCLPATSLPSQMIPLAPSIPLGGPFDIYDISFTSGELPLGQVFNFDFGSPILGDALTIDDIVRAQFESGATSVSETGIVIGPLMAEYTYDGVLQDSALQPPGGSQILADYTANVTGPGLLADLEDALLEIINENTDLLADLALEALLGLDICSGLGVAEQVCNDVLAGLEPGDIGITVDSIGNFSAEYSLQNSINPIPVPATLPLLALGVAMMGFTSQRRRRRA